MSLNATLEPRLTVDYDRESDILYIDRCPRRADQVSEDIGDDIVVRVNAGTGEVEGLDVLFFSARLMTSHHFELPISMDFKLLVEAMKR